MPLIYFPGRRRTCTRPDEEEEEERRMRRVTGQKKTLPARVRM